MLANYTVVQEDGRIKGDFDSPSIGEALWAIATLHDVRDHHIAIITFPEVDIHLTTRVADIKAAFALGQQLQLAAYLK